MASIAASSSIAAARSGAACSTSCLSKQQAPRTRVSFPAGQRSRRQGALRVSAVLTQEKVSLDMQKMEPLGDRLLVKPEEDSTATAGGVLLPASATKGQGDALIGEVVAVGEDVDIGVKSGDKVLYQKYSSADVETPAGQLTFVAQKSILATLA